MGAQEVTRGVQIGTAVSPYNPQQQHIVINQGPPLEGAEKSRIMSFWVKEHGTELFLRDIEAARQSVLTAAQNAVASGVWTPDDARNMLIRAYAYDTVIAYIKEGRPLSK